MEKVLQTGSGDVTHLGNFKEHVNYNSMQSEHIDKLASALCKANLSIQNVKKDKKNPFFKSKYSDLSTVFGSFRKIFAENQLSIVQTTCLKEKDILLVTTMLHGSGQWIKSEYPIKPLKQDPQGYGSAITYARRYSLSSIVGIASEDDDDGNAASSPNNVSMPSKSSGPKKKQQSPTQVNNTLISEAQAKRFYAIAKQSGKSDDTIKNFLADAGIDGTKLIPKKMYEEFRDWAQSVEEVGAEEIPFGDE